MNCQALQVVVSQKYAITSSRHQSAHLSAKHLAVRVELVTLQNLQAEDCQLEILRIHRFKIQMRTWDKMWTLYLIVVALPLL